MATLQGVATRPLSQPLVHMPFPFQTGVPQGDGQQAHQQPGTVAHQQQQQGAAGLQNAAQELHQVPQSFMSMMTGLDPLAAPSSAMQPPAVSTKADQLPDGGIMLGPYDAATEEFVIAAAKVNTNVKPKAKLNVGPDRSVQSIVKYCTNKFNLPGEAIQLYVHHPEAQQRLPIHAADKKVKLKCLRKRLGIPDGLEVQVYYQFLMSVPSVSAQTLEIAAQGGLAGPQASVPAVLPVPAQQPAYAAVQPGVAHVGGGACQQPAWATQQPAPAHMQQQGLPLCSGQGMFHNEPGMQAGHAWHADTAGQGAWAADLVAAAPTHGHEVLNMFSNEDTIGLGDVINAAVYEAAQGLKQQQQQGLLSQPLLPAGGLHGSGHPVGAGMQGMGLDVQVSNMAALPCSNFSQHVTSMQHVTAVAAVHDQQQDCQQGCNSASVVAQPGSNSGPDAGAAAPHVAQLHAASGWQEQQRWQTGVPASPACAHIGTASSQQQVGCSMGPLPMPCTSCNGQPAHPSLAGAAPGYSHLVKALQHAQINHPSLHTADGSNQGPIACVQQACRPRSDHNTHQLLPPSHQECCGVAGKEDPKMQQQQLPCGKDGKAGPSGQQHALAAGATVSGTQVPLPAAGCTLVYQTAGQQHDHQHVHWQAAMEQGHQQQASQSAWQPQPQLYSSAQHQQQASQSTLQAPQQPHDSAQQQQRGLLAGPAAAAKLEHASSRHVSDMECEDFATDGDLSAAECEMLPACALPRHDVQSLQQKLPQQQQQQQVAYKPHSAYQSVQQTQAQPQRSAISDASTRPLQAALSSQSTVHPHHKPQRHSNAAHPRQPAALSQQPPARHVSSSAPNHSACQLQGSDGHAQNQAPNFVLLPPTQDCEPPCRPHTAAVHLQGDAQQLQGAGSSGMVPPEALLRPADRGSSSLMQQAGRHNAQLFRPEPDSAISASNHAPAVLMEVPVRGSTGSTQAAASDAGPADVSRQLPLQGITARTGTDAASGLNVQAVAAQQHPQLHQQQQQQGGSLQLPENSHHQQQGGSTHLPQNTHQQQQGGSTQLPQDETKAGPSQRHTQPLATRPPPAHRAPLEQQRTAAGIPPPPLFAACRAASTQQTNSTSHISSQKDDTTSSSQGPCASPVFRFARRVGPIPEHPSPNTPETPTPGLLPPDERPQPRRRILSPLTPAHHKAYAQRRDKVVRELWRVVEPDELARREAAAAAAASIAEVSSAGAQENARQAPQQRLPHSTAAQTGACQNNAARQHTQGMQLGRALQPFPNGMPQQQQQQDCAPQRGCAAGTCSMQQQQQLAPAAVVCPLQAHAASGTAMVNATGTNVPAAAHDCLQRSSSAAGLTAGAGAALQYEDLPATEDMDGNSCSVAETEEVAGPTAVAQGAAMSPHAHGTTQQGVPRQVAGLQANGLQQASTLHGMGASQHRAPRPVGCTMSMHSQGQPDVGADRGNGGADVHRQTSQQLPSQGDSYSRDATSSASVGDGRKRVRAVRVECAQPRAPMQSSHGRPTASVGTTSSGNMPANSSQHSRSLPPPCSKPAPAAPAQAHPAQVSQHQPQERHAQMSQHQPQERHTQVSQHQPQEHHAQVSNQAKEQAGHSQPALPNAAAGLPAPQATPFGQAGTGMGGRKRSWVLLGENGSDQPPQPKMLCVAAQAEQPQLRQSMSGQEPPGTAVRAHHGAPGHQPAMPYQPPSQESQQQLHTAAPTYNNLQGSTNDCTLLRLLSSNHAQSQQGPTQFPSGLGQAVAVGARQQQLHRPQDAGGGASTALQDASQPQPPQQQQPACSMQPHQGLQQSAHVCAQAAATTSMAPPPPRTIVFLPAGHETNRQLNARASQQGQQQQLLPPLIRPSTTASISHNQGMQGTTLLQGAGVALDSMFGFGEWFSDNCPTIDAAAVVAFPIQQAANLPHAPPLPPPPPPQGQLAAQGAGRQAAKQRKPGAGAKAHANGNGKRSSKAKGTSATAKNRKATGGTVRANQKGMAAEGHHDAKQLAQPAALQLAQQQLMHLAAPLLQQPQQQALQAHSNGEVGAALDPAASDVDCLQEFLGTADSLLNQLGVGQSWSGPGTSGVGPGDLRPPYAPAGPASHSTAAAAAAAAQVLASSNHSMGCDASKLPQSQMQASAVAGVLPVARMPARQRPFPAELYAQQPGTAAAVATASADNGCGTSAVTSQPSSGLRLTQLLPVNASRPFAVLFNSNSSGQV